MHRPACQSQSSQRLNIQRLGHSGADTQLLALHQTAESLKPPPPLNLENVRKLGRTRNRMVRRTTDVQKLEKQRLVTSVDFPLLFKSSRGFANGHRCRKCAGYVLMIVSNQTLIDVDLQLGVVGEKNLLSVEAERSKFSSKALTVI